MSERTLKNLRLSDRDQEILDHVARYRMTTREVVHELFFRDAEVNAATKVLTRLLVGGCLSRYRLHDTHAYWTLSLRTARQRGLHAKTAEALGYEASIHHYGILLFCCAGPTKRTILTRLEFQSRFPQLFDRHLLRAPYYIDEQEGQQRLGLVLIDGGVDLVRLVRKCHAAIHRRSSMPAFMELLRNRGFVLTVVTAYPEKKERLQKAFEEDEYESVLYRVVVRSPLASLLANHAPRR